MGFFCPTCGNKIMGGLAMGRLCPICESKVQKEDKCKACGGLGKFVNKKNPTSIMCNQCKGTGVYNGN